MNLADTSSSKRNHQSSSLAFAPNRTYSRETCLVSWLLTSSFWVHYLMRSHPEFICSWRSLGLDFYRSIRTFLDLALSRCGVINFFVCKSDHHVNMVLDHGILDPEPWHAGKIYEPKDNRSSGKLLERHRTGSLGQIFSTVGIWSIWFSIMV